MNIILKGQRDLEKKLRQAKGAVSRGTVRSINKTATKVRTQAAKKIGQEVTLKAGYIKKKLEVKKASKNKEYAVVFATKRGVLLSHFNNRQLQRKAKQGGKKNAGISVKVGRNKPRKKMRGAFYLKLKGSGVVGIAIRNKGAKGRNNFEVKHAPSVSQIWNNIKDDMKPDVREWFYKTAQHEIDRELKKVGFK
ncbi:MAG: hypothetical protein GY694_17165 [Gammaproteobacteria bacterium]|nr:hypothetical protein [Gammaproteobacteria bacterium]